MAALVLLEDLALALSIVYTRLYKSDRKSVHGCFCICTCFVSFKGSYRLLVASAKYFRFFFFSIGSVKKYIYKKREIIAYVIVQTLKTAYLTIVVTGQKHVVFTVETVS